MVSIPKVINRMHEEVSAVCPIVSVSIGEIGNSSSVTFVPHEDATPAQIAAAQTVIDNFDWSDNVQKSWEVDDLRRKAKALYDQGQNEQDKVMKAAALVSLDTDNYLLGLINQLRAEHGMNPKPDITKQQLKQAIEDKLDTGDAD